MTVVILGEAEREFAKSVAYYGSKDVGLGSPTGRLVEDALRVRQRNGKLRGGQDARPDLTIKIRERK